MAKCGCTIRGVLIKRIGAWRGGVVLFVLLRVVVVVVVVVIVIVILIATLVFLPIQVVLVVRKRGQRPIFIIHLVFFVFVFCVFALRTVLIIL